jgi:hypothetical protein
VQITQTTGAGFAEPQAGFLAKPPAKPRRAVAPEIVQKTNAALDGVQDTTLREALAQLSLNVLTKR